MYSKKLEYYSEKCCAQSSNCVYVYCLYWKSLRHQAICMAFIWSGSMSKSLDCPITNKSFPVEKFHHWLSFYFVYTSGPVCIGFFVCRHILWHLKKRQQNSSSNRTAFMMSVKLVLLQFEIHTHTHTQFDLTDLQRIFGQTLTNSSNLDGFCSLKNASI